MTLLCAWHSDFYYFQSLRSNPLQKKKKVTLMFSRSFWFVTGRQFWTISSGYFDVFFNALSIILSMEIGAGDSYSINIHLCFFRWCDITLRCHSSCASYWLCLTEVLSSAVTSPKTIFSNLQTWMEFHFSWKTTRHTSLFCVNQINDPKSPTHF